MSTKHPVLTGLRALLTWTLNVTTIEDLKKILDEIDTPDLMAISLSTSSQSVGRIAWAEVARRRGYFALEFNLTEAELKITGPAPAIHESVLLSEPKKE
jgi:hypothetical protein